MPRVVRAFPMPHPVHKKETMDAVTIIREKIQRARLTLFVIAGLSLIAYTADLFSSPLRNVGNKAFSIQRDSDPISASSSSSSSSSSKQNDLKKLLLSVPFYVYEELVWMNATWKGMPVESLANGEDSFNAKHMDDFWFMYNALKHPMRTRNASEARLFVIPCLTNVYDSRIYYTDWDLCFEGRCNFELLEAAAETVTSTWQFQNHPEAHLAVASVYSHSYDDYTKQTVPRSYLDMLRDVANIRFEDYKTNRKSRWSVPKLYVSRGCALQTEKTQDVTMIATLLSDRPGHRDRGVICSWLDSHNDTFRKDICGQGSMCPGLAEAKLGFHVRGDSFGSQRLSDTILSGTVPIFTRHEQFPVLPDWYDFARISFSMEMEGLNETTFVEELSAILKDTETYERKLRVLLQNRHLFDWRTLYPFDTFMYMLQAELYPETRREQTFLGPQSIVRLPSPP